MQRETIKAAVERFLTAHRDWIAETDSPYITPEWWEAARALCDLGRVTEAEDDAKPILLAVDEFRDRCLQERRKMELTAHPQRGTDRLWQSINGLEQSLAPIRERRNIEPLERLIAAGQNLRQIAKMYCWTSEQIAQAIAEKGDAWKFGIPNPEDARQAAEIEAKWAARVIVDDARPERQKAKPVKESLRNLILQGLNRRQLKKNKPDATDEQISDMADALGIDPDTFVRLRPPAKNAVDVQRRIDQEHAEQQAKRQKFEDADDPQEYDLTDRILHLREQEFSALEIVEFMAEKGEAAATLDFVSTVLTAAAGLGDEIVADAEISAGIDASAEMKG